MLNLTLKFILVPPHIFSTSAFTIFGTAIHIHVDINACFMLRAGLIFRIEACRPSPIPLPEKYLLPILSLYKISYHYQNMSTLSSNFFRHHLFIPIIKVISSVPTTSISLFITTSASTHAKITKRSYWTTTKTLVSIAII